VVLDVRHTPLRAITLDYWDTIYDGAPVPERRRSRQKAVHDMLRCVGADLSVDDFDRLYGESAHEAERWWRDEHRGYTTADRLRWLLARVEIERPDDCEHIARACTAVDDTLVDYPPMLLPGAADAIRALADRFSLAIISDTGFASGDAQNRVLERDGLLQCFTATVYSMDVGHAKPHSEPFRRALEALDAMPDEVLHVGDIERTDVEGALDAGMRAVRLDVVRSGGSSAAEYVATSYGDLFDYVSRAGC
jgi:putative hydrolase of the HAD superfamily